MSGASPELIDHKASQVVSNRGATVGTYVVNTYVIATVGTYVVETLVDLVETLVDSMTSQDAHLYL